MRLFELNLTELGDVMIRLPMVAQALGHVSLERTDTYLHPDTPESEYAVDVMYGLVQGTMSIREFADKWCGSEDEMMSAFTRRLDRAHAVANHKLATTTPE